MSEYIPTLHVYPSELKCFRDIYADLQSSLNPDDIASELYSKELITPSEHEDITYLMHARGTRATKLLAAVERSISTNPANFTNFLDILDKFIQGRYQPIVLQARNMMGI